MWFDGWWMALWMMAFWIGLILLIVWTIRSLSGEGHSQAGDDRSRALQILDERYAHGEIDRDEYEKRKTTLKDT